MPARRKTESSGDSRKDPNPLHRFLREEVTGRHTATLGRIADELGVTEKTLKKRNGEAKALHVQELVDALKKLYKLHWHSGIENSIWQAAGQLPDVAVYATDTGELPQRRREHLHVARQGLSLAVSAMVSAVEIATLATRIAGGIAHTDTPAGVIHVAIQRRLAAHWRDCQRLKREPIRKILLRSLRRCWLKSMIEVAMSCERRQVGTPTSDIAAWTHSLRFAADAELAALDKSADLGAPSLLSSLMLSPDSPTAHEGSIALRALLAKDFLREIGAATEGGSSGETLFVTQLRDALERSGTPARTCPLALSSMLTQGWTVGEHRVLHCADLLVAYLSNELLMDPEAHVAFQNDLLHYGGLRDGSIPYDSFRAALREMAYPVYLQAPAASVPVAPRNLDDDGPAPKPGRHAASTDILSNLGGVLEEIASVLKEHRVQPGGEATILDEIVRSGGRRFAAPAAAQETRPPNELRLLPNEESILQGYLEWIVREFRYLPNELHLHRASIPLPLDRVFVTVRGYPGTVTEIQSQQQSSQRRDPRALRDRDQKKYFAAASAPSKDLANAFADSPTMVVLGDPGSGKTTLSRWIALNFARANLAQQGDEVMVALTSVDASAQGAGDRVSLGLMRLPIFLRIADVADAMKGTDKPLAEMLACGKFRSPPTYPQGHPRQGEAIEPGALTQLLLRHLTAQRAVVLLDGLDEVGSVEERLQVVGRIHAFVDEFFGGGREGNRLIVTSRLVGYEGNPLRNSIARYTIEPMNEAAIRLYCRCWHLNWAEAIPDLSEERRLGESARASDGLLAQIYADETSPLPQLACNPFMLGLLCALNLEGGERLPNSRSGLYSALVQRELWGSWISRRAGREQLRDAVVRLLAFIAEWIHRTSASGVVDRDALDKFTADLVQKDPAFATISSLAGELPTGVGLLIERGFRQYAFRHLTIQEYLAAVALVSDPAQVSAHVWDRSSDSRWREVVLFALGLLAQGDGPGDLARVCEELLEREDANEQRAPGVTLMLASAMNQIPRFPVNVAARVLDRLFVRYAQVSVNGRRTNFCELVEDVFGREFASQNSHERRAAAMSLLRSHAARDALDRQQAVAAIAARCGSIDMPLLLDLAKAARGDRRRGDWRIRWALVDLLSRRALTRTQLADAQRQMCDALDDAALATLRDPTKVCGSRYFEAASERAADEIDLPVDLFPLKRRLMSDESALAFVRSSPGWMKVVIALHGGLGRLGLQPAEDILLLARARPDSALLDIPAEATAFLLDGDIEPKLELMRSVPLELDLHAIWRASPLSSWIADQLDDRPSEGDLAVRLLDLWSAPDSLELAELSEGFEWHWSGASAASGSARHLLLTDILLTLAALGHEPDDSSRHDPADLHILEMVRVEFEWLEAYLEEPAYRARRVIESGLAGHDMANRVPAQAELPPASTQQAVEVAFHGDLKSAPEWLGHPAGLLVWRAFSEWPLPEEVRSEFSQLGNADLLLGLVALAQVPSVPWLNDEQRVWTLPCLSPDQASTPLLALLLGIDRIPSVAAWPELRSSCLALAAALGMDCRPLLPLAIHLARQWKPTDDLFRSALRPWLGNEVPETDDGWKAVHERKPTVEELTDPVATFWALRLSEPAESATRRHWLASLYEVAAAIAEPVARLGAELHVFTLCDADETMPQWRRMMRMAESLTHAAQRDAWIERIERVKSLVVERDLGGPARGGRTFALADLVGLLGQRPIKAQLPLGVFDEERPVALAMFWSYLLSSDDDDPVYSCAVVLDTLGKNLAARADDLLLSLVMFEVCFGAPISRQVSIVPIPESKERRRELLSTALMALLRFPRDYDMLVEWLLRRMWPYLRRLDREHVPMAIAVASRLGEVSRTPVLGLLCPRAFGDAETALCEAWNALEAIPDPYLRWQSEWLVGSVSRRRRSPAAMLADIAALADPGERHACMAVLLMEGHGEMTAGDLWQRLLAGLPEQRARALAAFSFQARSRDADPDMSVSNRHPDLKGAMFDSAQAWLRAWKAEQRSPQELAAVGIIELKFGALRRSRLDGTISETAELLRQAAPGRLADASVIRPDPVTGLRFSPLTSEAVEILRNAMGPEDVTARSCPLLLQLLRGGDPQTRTFLRMLSTGRADVWGNWAALMLAEQGVWTNQIVARVRALLKSSEAVLRNRALFVFARGSDWRSLSGKTELLSAANVGSEVIEEMASTLARPDRFHPVVDMMMIFALDRVVFDDSEQVRTWLEDATRPGVAQRQAKAVLQSICRASLPVCRMLAEHLVSPVPVIREALIRACICLWERHNWAGEVALWQTIRGNLFHIGASADAVNAASALEALGHLGLGGLRTELLELAQREPSKRSAGLRALGIAADTGQHPADAETTFMVESLEADDASVRVAAAEALLRTQRSVLVQEQYVSRETILSAFVAHLKGYFVGAAHVRKVRHAAEWLNQVTHEERANGAALEETTFARLLLRIAAAIARQSFVSTQRQDASQRLSAMLAIAAGAGELMPGACEALLAHPAHSLDAGLATVVHRHESYVARRAALVLLSLRRRFSPAFAQALEASMSDLSLMQTIAIDCVSRIEFIDEAGLVELARIVASTDTLVAFAAARVIQRIAASHALADGIQARFELVAAKALRRALDASEEPRAAFYVESDLDDWNYRTVLLGLLRDAREDALFFLQFPASPLRVEVARSERSELTIVSAKNNESIDRTVTLGAHPAKSKHPLMHQAAAFSARGEVIPSEVMTAVEQVQKVAHQFNVSAAKVLHLAVQSRFESAGGTSP